MTALQKAVCRDFVPYLGPFLDGELDTATQIQIEEHLGRCSPCGERLELLRAQRASLKRVVRMSAPAGLRSRIQTAMMAEQARTDARAEAKPQEQKPEPPSRFWSARTLVPVAAAAALALTWGVASRGPAISKEARPGDDLLADLVAEHSQPLPPEHTDPHSVRGMEKYVGVPVHPSRFERSGARLVGGRVLPMHQQRAAMLQYVVGQGNDQRRVSVLIYDPQKIQIHAADLAPRSVGTAQVQVTTTRGYSVAVAERGGVGYAVATDLDADRSAQFVSAVYEE
jgi:anti-sigma factor RsiW